MVRDGPSGLLTMRLRADARPHPEEARSGVSKDEEGPEARLEALHPDEGGTPVSKDGKPRSGVWKPHPELVEG